MGRVETSSSNGSWYKADLHHHSGASDGIVDLGTLTHHAKSLGYNAIFLSDHDHGKNQFASLFEDINSSWTIFSSSGGTWFEKVCKLSTAIVRNDMYSYHFKGNASDDWILSSYIPANKTGEIVSPIYGDMILKFSVYPMATDSYRSIGVSISIEDYGFTWQNGTHDNRKLRLQYVLGSKNWEGNITTSEKIVREIKLSHTLGIWNTYTIKFTKTLSYLGLNLQGFNGFQITLAVIGNANYECEAYFDRVWIYNIEPWKTAAEVFAIRNTILQNCNTENFMIFPSVEFSKYKHMNYFKFDFMDPGGHVTSDKIATDPKGIVDWCHAQGYLVQVNHPGSTRDYPDGVEGMIANNAFGADLIELNYPYPDLVIWDSLLKKGIIIVGVWSSDSHSVVRIGERCTMIYSPSLTLESLLKSLFEGKVYMAPNNFTGTLIFNTETSTEPYPSRYIRYISANDPAKLYLRINQGLKSGWKLYWIRNGTYFLTETITATSLEVTKSFTMPDDSNYFRVEVRDEMGKIVTMSEPIFFKKLPMPTGMYAYCWGFTTPTGANYTNNLIRGITLASYSNEKLNMIIEGVGTSTTQICCGDKGMPKRVVINNVAYFYPLNTKAEFESLSISGWYYDQYNKLLYLKAVHSSKVKVELDWANKPPPEEALNYSWLYLSFPITALVTIVILYIFRYRLFSIRKRR